MNSLFSINGKIMHYGTKLGYLLWLQALTVICSLPIITAGAAFTAMHKILLQIYRDTESNITKTFFTCFLQNLRQAIILWVIYFVYFAFLAVDYLLVRQATAPALRAAVYILPILFLAGYLSFVWVFPLLSRYKNTIFQTIKLSFTLVILRPVTTVVVTILGLIPVVALMVTLYSFPYVVFLGITIPGLLQTLLYSRIYDFLEDTNWRKQQAEELIES